jgi:predicted DNA-binding protein (MmcQ/YjbR family)
MWQALPRTTPDGPRFAARLRPPYRADHPFTEHCWPFGPEYDVFKVGGRIFMITMTIRGRALVNLKADPQNRCSIRNLSQYRARLSHEQKHWITVVPGEDISEDLLAELIDDSWHQVVNKAKKPSSAYVRLIFSQMR